MNKKLLITMIIILLLLIATVICIIFIIKENSPRELEDFDISPNVLLDLSSTSSESNEKEQAYVTLCLQEIDLKTFLNEYEIEKIVFNNELIKNDKIFYEKSFEGFGFEASNYKDENSIKITIKKISTNEKYFIELIVPIDIYQ